MIEYYFNIIFYINIRRLKNNRHEIIRLKDNKIIPCSW